MKILTLLKSFFRPKKDNLEDMKKYLIVGLGNIGEKYDHTRHNIGFSILDEIAKQENVIFEPQKLGSIAKFRYKGRLFILLKPATYMNLSGKAVKYWITKEKILLENLLIICDDLNIPFGTIRLKPKGSAGGHNGLLDINDSLQTQNYARFRFGVGDTFKKGNQVDYVLGNWDDDETKKLPERLKKSYELVKSFGTSGIANTMSDFNGK
jgi:PTH1 family peptidyl-tRNA hydrolase